MHPLLVSPYTLNFFLHTLARFGPLRPDPVGPAASASERAPIGPCARQMLLTERTILHSTPDVHPHGRSRLDV
ncbi:hypothetical protein EJ03DRAFT_331861 [Teratosphaeria nubilosa]|uniref:Uncharacterized protein n=1 Tax=Teratosphaeria nubilosa TaxID=161662 RepID=A0A6G1KVR2_9PEZI|nr:hypothetical protein EJ03DRAFT_331861 [Teratosphaeria nubilosa]